TAAFSAAYDAREHALLGCAPDLDAADAALAPRVTPAVLAAAAASVPEPWLAGEPGFDGPDAVRAAYVDELSARACARAAWLASAFRRRRLQRVRTDRVRRAPEPSELAGWSLRAPVPLADRSAQHRGAARARPHRAHRRSRRGAGPAAGPARHQARLTAFPHGVTKNRA
ncbi:MAG TPA: hypothetical protein VFT67_08055, partial [Jatrophihabitantaceae bacterium]|nr:hypothetical protein [Jatrophihabitantaceae bacterium]